MKAKATYLLVAIALLSSGVTYAALSSDGSGRTEGRAHAARSGASALRISGHVGGLYPGARKGIPLKVRNRSNRWVVLRAVTADVGRGAPGCARDYLSTVPKNVSYRRIRPHKTRHIGIRIRMWKGTPDACQGVKLPLTFEVRAGRQ